MKSRDYHILFDSPRLNFFYDVRKLFFVCIEFVWRDECPVASHVQSMIHRQLGKRLSPLEVSRAIFFFRPKVFGRLEVPHASGSELSRFVRDKAVLVAVEHHTRRDLQQGSKNL